jgi:integrase
VTGMKKRALGNIREATDRNGNKRYYAQIMSSGKRHTGTFSTKWEAEKWLEEVASGEEITKIQPADMLFLEASDRFISDATVSRGQRDNYIVTQRQLLRQWPGKRLSEITRQDVAAYLSRRKKEVGVSILRRELSFIRMIYAKAADFGVVIPSPELAIKRPQHRLESREDRLSKLIRPEEIRAMLDASQVLLRVYLLVLLYTGMRPSEAAGLWWEQPAKKDWLRGYVDLERGGFSMVGTKTETRFVPAHPILISELSKLPRATPLVFIPALYIGHQRPYMHFRKSFDVVKRKAGIERDITLYSFRHTARSKMEACGISTAIAETIIGHSDKEFKFTYIHLDDEVLIREIGKLTY